MFKRNINLAQYSHYKIGGTARYFYIAKNIKQLISVVQKAKKEGLPIFILGAGTNLLISDEGFNGLVLKPEIKKLEIIKKSKNKTILVRAGAGILMSELLSFLIFRNLAGLEWAGGLPGTVGGAVRGNAGCFGGEMKDAIKEVISLDIDKSEPNIIKRSKKQCLFDYRHSIFGQKNNKEIILEVIFNFKKGDKKNLQEIVDKNINYRQIHTPLEYPTIGSMFKNIDLKKVSKKWQLKFASQIKTDPFPVMPAAYLISQAGLKGKIRGGAMISTKHPNFIINFSEAKAKDVNYLINLVKSEVKKNFGVELEEEIVNLGS